MVRNLVLTNSQKIAGKKEGVGTYCFIPFSGSRIAFAVDKAIAHTKGYVKSQDRLYISMMWCHCILSSQHSNLRDLRMKDNFNNTFLSKCPS